MRARGRRNGPDGNRSRTAGGTKPAVSRAVLPTRIRTGHIRAGRIRAGRIRATAGTVPLLLAALLTGCGIRATSVPTDFGPAPSRAPCALSQPTVQSESDSARGVPAQIFLVCSQQLVTVDRIVQVPADSMDDRATIAQALLDQLQSQPPTPEHQAGFTTYVRGGTTVTGRSDTGRPLRLRLGTPVQDLTTYALAQIVCTFANSAAADEDGAVVLGGPSPEPLRRYQCTPEVRARPGTTAPPSTPVPQR